MVITGYKSMYQQGYNDAMCDFRKKPKTDVLDKVRAEIEQLRLHKAQFITSDNKVCIDSQEVLNIIDKYTDKSKE